MLSFGNFDLNYADNNAFWEFFSHFRYCATLGMFLKEYLIFYISYIEYSSPEVLLPILALILSTTTKG